MSIRRLRSRSRVSERYRPALPLRHRHGYAAVLHSGLPTGKINPVQRFPPARAVRTAIQPRSTGFELAEVLRGFTPLVPRVHLPVSLAGPAPSGTTGTSRRCRGCSPPDPADSPNPATPSSYRLAATRRRHGSHTRTRTHSASWRTVSHPHSNLSASRRTHIYAAPHLREHHARRRREPARRPDRRPPRRPAHYHALRPRPSVSAHRSPCPQFAYGTSNSTRTRVELRPSADHCERPRLALIADPVRACVAWNTVDQLPTLRRPIEMPRQPWPVSIVTLV
jgi:hypothetical protein